MIDTRIVGYAQTVGHGVELLEGFALHGIAEPATGVALLVDPRQGVGNVELTDALAGLADLGGRGECDALGLGTGRQRLDEVEDVARQGLGDTQGGELHEDIDDLLFLGHASDTVDIVVGEERITVPLGVIEAQGDIIGQFDITEQQLQTGSILTVVHIMGRLPAEHVLGTLGEHTLEAHGGNLCTDIVAVDK